MKTMILFGATSFIAHAIARLYVKDYTDFILIGRNKEKLQQNAQDLEVLGAEKTYIYQCDFADSDQINSLFNTISENHSSIELAVVAQGMLPQSDEIVNTMTVNTLSVMLCLQQLSTIMPRGTITVIGSVAGDRGRKSNYLYGASKAAIETFANGLRQKVNHINIITVKPGFIETPMTANMTKNFLWRTPKQIAPRIKWAIEKQKRCLYVPGFWRYIMWVIKAMPEMLLKRLDI